MMKKMSDKQYRKWYLKLNQRECFICQNYSQFLIKEYKYWAWIDKIRAYVRYDTMLIPKRHITCFTDLTIEELQEWNQMVYSDIFNIFRKAHVRGSHGNLVDRMAVMLHVRDKYVEKGKYKDRPEHLHFHLTPDHDHFFDSVLTRKTQKINVVEKLRPYIGL